jgi:hypothetical protein
MTIVEYFDDTGALQRESTKHYNLNRGVVLLLALGAIEDLDVKLDSPTVVIKHQDTSLVKIMILSKTVPATSKESNAIAIVIHLQLIRWPAAGCFSENSLPKLMTLHEFCELQRKMLLFAALGTSEREERKQIA